ncbi:MAG: MFS transporter [Thermoprotei archaeon]
MSNNISKTIEEGTWTRAHTWSFISFSVGMLLEAYIFGLASVAEAWYSVPKSLGTLLLVWAPLWLIIGIIVAGPISDRIGRKTTFYYTMALYGIGAVGVAFANSYALVLPFLAMLLFSAGGEMNTIMVATHEIMPRKNRSKAMFYEINFINFGGLLLGAVAFASAYSSIGFQKYMIGLTALLVLAVLVYSRLKMPESVRWLEFKGKKEEAETEAKKYFGAVDPPATTATTATTAAAPTTGSAPLKMLSIPVRLLIVIAVAGANTIGYGLMTYSLGYYYYGSNAFVIDIIILVTNISEFGTGLVLGAFADRVSRKLLLLVSFIGAAVVTYGIYFTVGSWYSNLAIFLALLVVLNVFIGISYLTEDTLKGEIWPTERRGTLTALARFVSIGLYIPALIYGSTAPIDQYMLFNALIWTVGLAAAAVWYVKGHETGKGVSISVASGEV